MTRLQAVLITVLLAVGGCTVGPPSPGSLQATILGLPEGVQAAITLSGPEGFSKLLTASETLSGLRPGSYTASGATVGAGGLIYNPTLSAAILEVQSNQTATLNASYSPPAGSTVSSTITVTIGGTIKLGPATLTIPPDGLVGSTNATVTLTDLGKLQSSDPGDPLKYASDAFTVTATAVGTTSIHPNASNLRINPDKPPTLGIVPNGDALSNTQSLIVGNRDPNEPNIVSLHRPNETDQGPRFAPVSAKYTALDKAQWVVAVPILKPKPEQKEVLQVPWYYQSGIPWCAPTSLTAMLRYYDFDETASNIGLTVWVDPLNASFGQSTALGPWQTARAQLQPRDSGGGWGAMDNLGLKGKYTIYLWDAAAFLPDSGAKGGYDDFKVYTILVNTGIFGLIDRRPMVMIVDNWWHSVTVVGIDGDGLYYHDSNGSIAFKRTWDQFQQDATDWKKDSAGKQVFVQTIWTGVLNTGAPGVSVKNVNKRRGSLVLARSDISFQDTQGTTASLEWDGANPHTYGYYFPSPSASASSSLGAVAQPGQALNYRYRIANVTNVSLTYTGEVALANSDGSVIGSPVSTSSTVGAYTIGSYVNGTFTVPNTNGAAMIRFRLLQGGQLQDVKFYHFLTPLIIR